MTVLSEFVDCFVAWAKARGEDISPAVAETLLVAHQALDDTNEPGHWHCEDLTRLLLEYYPRHIASAPDIVADTASTAAALFDYLAETDQFTTCSDRARRLRRTLVEVADEFGEAMRDPTRYGPTKSLVIAMEADRVDVSDPAAVERWMAEFNNRPFAERVALTGGAEPNTPSLREMAGLPRTLPPVRVRPAAELAADARACPLLAGARELARWVGGPRPVTDTGVLRVADATAAASELGLWPGGARVGRRPRSARQIPGLMRRWTLALETGMLARSASRVFIGPAMASWPDGSAEAVLAVWERALESVVSAGLDFGEEAEHVPETLEGMAAAVLTRLFLEREPCPLIDLAEGLEWAAVDSHPLGALEWGYWRETRGCPVRMMVDRLVELGALRTGEGLVSLSPLGVWAVRRQLAELGVEVPERAPLDGSPAAELIEALVDMPDADVKAELAGWLAARPPERAATELLAAAARSGPASRAVALTAVQDLGPVAEPAWREALAEPSLRAYAAAQLPDAQHAITRADADWMLIDVCAALLRFDAIEETVAHLDELGTPQELVAMMDGLGRVSHPDTVDVLTSIGDHHPDGKVSKAARKAAFRSRSRLSQG